MSYSILFNGIILDSLYWCHTRSIIDVTLDHLDLRRIWSFTVKLDPFINIILGLLLKLHSILIEVIFNLFTDVILDILIDVNTWCSSLMSYSISYWGHTRYLLDVIHDRSLTSYSILFTDVTLDLLLKSYSIFYWCHTWSSWLMSYSMLFTNVMLDHLLRSHSIPSWCHTRSLMEVMFDPLDWYYTRPSWFM